MTERWHSTSALAGLPGMPGSRSIRLWGERKGWISRQHGRVRQWSESSLPAKTQRALQDRRAASSATESPTPNDMANGDPSGVPAQSTAQQEKPMTPPETAPSPGGEATEHPKRYSNTGDTGAVPAGTYPESRGPATPPETAKLPSPGGEALESTGGLSRRPQPPPREPTTPQLRASRAPSAAGEAVADARLDIVERLNRWLEGHRGGSEQVTVLMAQFADRYNDGTIQVHPDTRILVPRASRATLARWRKLRRTKGWSGLIPTKRGSATSRCSIEADPEVRDIITAILTDRPHSCAVFAYKGVSARLADQPDRVPGLRAVQRFIRRWRQVPENERLLSQLSDPDKHRSRRMPAPGDAAADIKRLNQIWEGDSTSVDVLCVDGHRKLIAIIDVYSRRMRVLVTERDCAESVIALFRRCLLEWGVPEVWRCDNGASYANRWMQRVIADSEITPDPCLPYDPDAKPFVERALKTLSHGLLENLPGYKGHSIAEQQRLRARHAFSKRLGMPEGEVFGVSLSAAELQQRCDDWLAYEYERSPHGGLDGRSPFDVAAAWRRPVKRIAHERALDVLLYRPAGSRGGWARVGIKGIRVDNGCYIHPDLPPPGPEDVQVRQDPTDLGRILVLDAHGAFICWAVDPDLLGIDRAEIAAQMKARARAIDAQMRAEARVLKRRIKPETIQDEIIDAARRRHGTVVALPQPSTDHETPALAGAERAIEQRDADETPALDAAVGDEAPPEPDPYLAVVHKLRARGAL